MNTYHLDGKGSGAEALRSMRSNDKRHKNKHDDDTNLTQIRDISILLQQIQERHGHKRGLAQRSGEGLWTHGTTGGVGRGVVVAVAVAGPQVLRDQVVKVSFMMILKSIDDEAYLAHVDRVAVGAPGDAAADVGGGPPQHLSEVAADAARAAPGGGAPVASLAVDPSAHHGVDALVAHGQVLTCVIRPTIMVSHNPNINLKTKKKTCEP